MHWQYTYNEAEIGSDSTITGTTPGRKLARVVTELQGQVITGIVVQEGDDYNVTIEDNVATITIKKGGSDDAAVSASSDLENVGFTLTKNDTEIVLGFDASGVEDYKVLQVQAGSLTLGWVRAH